MSWKNNGQAVLGVVIMLALLGVVGCGLALAQEVPAGLVLALVSLVLLHALQLVQSFRRERRFTRRQLEILTTVRDQRVKQSKKEFEILKHLTGQNTSLRALKRVERSVQKMQILEERTEESVSAIAAESARNWEENRFYLRAIAEMLAAADDLGCTQDGEVR